MRSVVTTRNMRDLARGASLLLIAGLAAGCSSGVSRFTGDDFVTGSIGTPNQQQIINNQRPAAQTDYIAAPSSGGVTRSALPPVAGTSVAAANATISAPPAAGTPIAAPRMAETTPVQKQAPVQVASAAGTRINPLSSAMERVADDEPSRTAIPSARPATSSQAGVLKVPTAATAPMKQAVAQAGGSYTVEGGDTMIGVARKLGVSVAELKTTNGLTTDSLRSGQKLVVPGPGVAVAKAQAVKAPVAAAAAKVAEAPKPAEAKAVVAKKVEAEKAKVVQAVVEAPKTKTIQAAAEAVAPKAEPVAYTPPKTKAIEAVAQDADDEAPGATGIGKMRWPAKGRIVSNYGAGSGKSRDGIDIAVPEGTSVKAAENGVVIYAGDGLKEFGNTVLVRHDDGLVTVYGHNGALNVKRGQKVKRGDQIATSGMSGETDTPKLHFEVRKNSAPVNPSTYLQ